MTRKLQAVIARLGRGARHEADVHFHQGPQGQPMPCFDERCPNPGLSVSRCSPSLEERGA